MNSDALTTISSGPGLKMVSSRRCWISAIVDERKKKVNCGKLDPNHAVQQLKFVLVEQHGDA